MVVSLFTTCLRDVDIKVAIGGSAMAEDDRRSTFDRRAGQDRRRVADTRSEAEKRLIGERRSNKDRRGGLDRRSKHAGDALREK